jgi:signal transduction histidine kinase
MLAAVSDPRARRWRVLALLAASLVPAAMDLLRQLARNLRPDLRALAASTLGVLVLLGVLTAVFDLAMRRRVTAGRCFAVCAAVAVGVGVAESFAALGLDEVLGLGWIEPWHRSAAVAARTGVAAGVLGMGLFAMAVALPFAASGAREAERLRTAAELARLRANLQPHFLFNTLSTVAGLVGEDPREARRLIGTLGDLLRDSFADADDLQTLDAEIAWLKHYADILETRHRGSIAFQWEIDEATRGVRIPRLLLQPLVENAVKHGALRRPEGGVVAVRASLAARPDARLTCIVEDNGPGPAARTARRPGGRGIDLVTRRLALAYGEAAELRFESGGGRTRAVVAIPVERSS